MGDQVSDLVDKALAAANKEFADDVNDFGDVGYSLKLAQEALQSIKDSTCKNCKHWVFPANWGSIPSKGECTTIVQRFWEPENDAIALAVVQRDGLGACLRTAAEFGCILFEAK